MHNDREHSTRLYERGISLIELLVVIALILSFTRLVVVETFNSVYINTLDAQVRQIVSSLLSARHAAMNNVHNSHQGIHFTEHDYTRFENRYDADAKENSTTSLGPAFTFSGPGEFIFHKITGDVATSETLTIYSLASRKSKSITVRSNGTLQW